MVYAIVSLDMQANNLIKTVVWKRLLVPQGQRDTQSIRKSS